MTTLQSTDAPLGLGFEMPDGVWVLEGEGGIWALGDPRLYHAWMTEADGWAAKFARESVPASNTPKFYRFDELKERRSNSGLVVGVILRDRDWNEIGRRYWA